MDENVRLHVDPSRAAPELIGGRYVGRKAVALLAAATATLAACGYDGPARPSDLASITPSTTSPVTTDPATRSTSEPSSDGGRLRSAPVAGNVSKERTRTLGSSTTTSSTSTPTSTPARSSTAPPSTAPSITAPERIEPRRVLVIGDSSAAGMRWTAGAQEALRGADFTLDLESCRRLVAQSCNGREGYTPSTALDALREQAEGDHDTLIMATGYNDMDRNFADAFDRIVAEARAQGIETILWTTYREEVGYQLPTGASSAYSEMNDQLALRVLSGEYPELRILDWWGYTQDTPSWLAGDGVHFARAGSFGLADMISRELAALDGRPCPVAWELWTDPADPCPPPLEELERRGELPAVLYLYDAIG